MYEVNNGNVKIPGKIWIKSNQSNIDGFWADDTVENRNVQQSLDLAAGMSTSSAKGDSASLADFRQQYPTDQSARAFQQFCTRHQVSPRHAITLELEAKAQGLDLAAMTFRPAMAEGDRTESDVGDDPLLRKNLPMVTEDEGDFDENDDDYPKVSDGDVDSIRVPANISLRRLQRAGIVSRRMSQEQFAARLARMGVDASDSLRKSVLASMVRFFKANGDAWGPQTALPLTLPQGQVVNLQARNDDFSRNQRDLLAAVSRLRKHVLGETRTC